MRRADDHGRALVVGDELGARDEAEGVGHTAAERAVAHDHARHPLGGPDEVEDPLLLGESARRTARAADRPARRPRRELRPRSGRRAPLVRRARAPPPRAPRTGRARCGLSARASGPPSGHARRARRPFPTAGGRTACVSSGPVGRTGASGRGRGPRPAPRDALRSSTRRGTQARGAPSTGVAGGSRRRRARTRARSAGTRRARRPRRRRRRPAAPPPPRARTLQRRRPARAGTTS